MKSRTAQGRRPWAAASGGAKGILEFNFSPRSNAAMQRKDCGRYEAAAFQERQRGKNLADRMLAIGKDCASRLEEPFLSVDHAELLYDADGLPR